MRVDRHDAQRAGRRGRYRVVLRARGTGFPQRFGRRRACDVPVDGQPIVVQHVDERDVFGSGTEQREIAP